MKRKGKDEKGAERWPGGRKGSIRESVSKKRVTGQTEG